MKNLEGLKLVTRGEREILMTRELNAPRRLVFRAFTKPGLVKRWLLGPPGWSMPICEIDLRSAERTATYGLTRMDASWVWAECIGKSWRPSGWSPRRDSTKLGIRVKRWIRSSCPKRAELRESRRR